MASDEERSLARSLFIARTRLNEECQSMEEEVNILCVLEHCLSQVKQSPSKIMKKALSPVVTSLIHPYWLRHVDEEISLLITSCLNEVMRILAPLVPYDDETIKRVLHMIVESFQDHDETDSSQYSRRAAILKTFSELKTSILLIDLGMQNRIYYLIHYLFISTWSEQQEDVVAAMRNI